jgi:DUF1680 family protein
MCGSLNRRRILEMAMLSMASTTLARSALAATPENAAGAKSALRAQPFALHSVRLRPGALLDALEVNRAYLVRLDPDRLLHMFRVTAGLPSSAEPLGGWEAPDNELRGHFTGHYLSACALLAAQTGDSLIRERGVRVAAALAACQRAIGSGYLSAFPQELFDRLRQGKPAWAPFYTLHKIMAGLLDTHTLSGDRAALDTLLQLASWVERWVQPLDDAQMARVIEREYGGMNEVLYNLAARTGEARWTALARRFDKQRLYAPLVAGRDELEGLHVNTTIPQVIGAARGFEVSGDPHLRDAAMFFWHTVAERRTYCTGGTSNGESWNTPPAQLAHELSGYTEESCVTYNMLKLTRLLWTWTTDAHLADYYERALFNGILGVQHPADGEKLYYLALASGYWKLFGTPLQDFWCCTGSMAESFSKLGDSIYFHDDSGIYVNLFIPSELNWAERGIRLSLETRFPEEETVRLRVQSAQGARITLRIRIPYWSSGAAAWINGTPVEPMSAPGSYLSLEREWSGHDEVVVRLPMHLYTAAMPDNRSLQAIMYGPLVLAGRLGTEGLNAANLRAEPTKPRKVPEYRTEPLSVPDVVARSADPTSWLEPVSGRPLEFRTRGQPTVLTLVPLNRIFDERYVVYWKLSSLAA